MMKPNPEENVEYSDNNTDNICLENSSKVSTADVSLRGSENEMDVTTERLEPDENQEEGQDTVSAKSTSVTNSALNEKSLNLPLSKIRLIMKTDPDVSICSTDSAFLITKCTVSKLLSRLSGQYGLGYIEMVNFFLQA